MEEEEESEVVKESSGDKKMSCDDVRELYRQAAEEGLADKLRFTNNPKVLAHLAKCPDCDKWVEEQIAGQ